MCFSTGASFSASVVLSAIGIVSVVKSQTLSQRILSCIPLIFAVQQFTEGIVWLSLLHSDYAPWLHIAIYVFLIFAQVIWPLYIPLSVRAVETEKSKRKALSYFLVFGAVVSAYFAFCLVFYHANAVIDGHHIRYDIDFPMSHRWFFGIFYFIPAMLSAFMSSIKRIRLFGLALLASYIFTRVLYKDYIISVWCFFGAIVSMLILSVILQQNNNTKQQAVSAT